MASIVIIGAGLTGISTAYHLEQVGITDYKLFEKEPQAGGLCRSIIQDGFTFDYTGHLLHIGDNYFRKLIASTVGFEQLNTINRRSFIYSHDTYTRYPFQINLHGLPTAVIVECIQEYVNRPKIENPQTFREWVDTTFGIGFGRHFFYQYQEKIFACDIDTLTASWTNKFVPQTSLQEILYGSLENQSTAEVGYNAQFFYPKHGGIFSWVQQLAEKLLAPINYEMCIESIDCKNKELLFSNGHIERYDILINTMPLDQLLTRLKEPSDEFLQSAAHHLKCNQVINFNLGINRPALSDKHWIYFPEKKYPFYRIGFPHNFADSMAPAACSSLYGEFAHINQSNEWVDKTLQQSLTAAKKLLNISDNEIATECIIRIPYAYVIFDQWRDQHLSTIHKRLQERNIHSIGRYGEWKYASMQDAVLDGKKMAEIIMENRYEKNASAIAVRNTTKFPRQPLTD